MARLKPLFRIVAVLNALLLIGVYVCYRSGVVEAFGAKRSERPVQVDPPTTDAAPTPLASTVPANAIAPATPDNSASTKTLRAYITLKRTSNLKALFLAEQIISKEIEQKFSFVPYAFYWRYQPEPALKA